MNILQSENACLSDNLTCKLSNHVGQCEPKTHRSYSDDEEFEDEPRSKGKEMALVPPAELTGATAPSAAQAEYDLDDADIPIPTIDELAEDDNDLLEFEIITKQESEKHTRYDVATEVPDNHEITRYAPLPNNGRLEPGIDVELDDRDFIRIVYVVRNKAWPRAIL